MRSGFFNSVKGDRRYDAGFFAEYFATFIGNGVFPNPSTNLQVVANDDMTVKVASGAAWINGYVLFNDIDTSFRLTNADGQTSRIDRIVAQYDKENREITVLVKEGSYSDEPLAPEIERSADFYELALADVKVAAGAISITQADITDLRLDKELCGIVHGVVDQVDTTAIFNQFESWYSQTKDEYDADIASWTQEKKDQFNQWYSTNITEFENRFNNWFSNNTSQWDADFTTWFDNIKGRLDGDIGVKLTNKVMELEEGKVDKVSGKGLSTNDYTNAEKAEVAKVKNKADKTYVDQEIASIPDVDISGKAEKTVVDEHIAVDNLIKHKANQISLADSKFSSNNVEAGMSELFTNVSNGKDLVSGAITGVDDSVVIPTEPSFADLAGAIGGISTGKKFLTGTAKSTSNDKRVTANYFFGYNKSNVDTVTVHGLTFHPSMIIVMYSMSGLTVYDKDGYQGTPYVQFAGLSGEYPNTGFGEVFKMSNEIYVKSTSFRLPVRASNADVTWIAYE